LTVADDSNLDRAYGEKLLKYFNLRIYLLENPLSDLVGNPLRDPLGAVRSAFWIAGYRVLLPEGQVEFPPVSGERFPRHDRMFALDNVLNPIIVDRILELIPAYHIARDSPEQFLRDISQPWNLSIYGPSGSMVSKLSTPIWVSGGGLEGSGVSVTGGHIMARAPATSATQSRPSASAGSNPTGDHRIGSLSTSLAIIAGLNLAMTVASLTAAAVSLGFTMASSILSLVSGDSNNRGSSAEPGTGPDGQSANMSRDGDTTVGASVAETPTANPIGTPAEESDSLP